MAVKKPKKERGVFEKVPGSGIWWIRYKTGCVEHREKVGRRSDAINVYRIRKADILRGVKMPANMRQKGIKFSVIAQDAIDWYESQDRKDVRNFRSRMRTIFGAFRAPLTRLSHQTSTASWGRTIVARQLKPLQECFRQGIQDRPCGWQGQKITQA